MIQILRRARPASRWLAAMSVAILAACGGGGGGVADVGSSGNQWMTPLALEKQAQASAAIELPVSYAESLLTLGYEVDRWLKEPVGEETQVSCLGGGQRTLHWSDANANRTVDAGDTIEVTLHHCLLPATAAVFTGSARLSLQAPPAGKQAAAFVELTGSGLQHTSGIFTFSWTGALHHESWSDGLRQGFSERSDDAVALEFAGTSGGTPTVDRITGMLVSREELIQRSGIATTMQMTLSSGLLQGQVQLSTPQALFAYFDTYPSEGQLMVTGARSTSLGVSAEDGRQLATLRGSWGLNEAMPWFRMVTGFPWWHAGDLPGAYGNVKDIQFDTLWSVGAASVPVAPQQREASLHFSHALTPASFDVSLVREPKEGDYDWGDAIVTARAETVESSLVLHLPTQLQPGREYLVQLPPQAPLAGTRGQVLAGTGFRLVVDNAAVASVSAPAGRVVLAGRPVSLEAGTSLSSGADPVRSYTWRQLNGAPLNVTPDAAHASVDVASQPGAAAFEADMLVTITTAAGVVDTDRVRLQVVPSAAGAMLMQVKARSADWLARGADGLVALPADMATAEMMTAGIPTDVLRTRIPPVGTEFAKAAASFQGTLMLTLPPGVPLAPGTYDAPVNIFKRSSTASMDLWWPMPACDDLTGRFMLLDVALGTTSSGLDLLRLERLAVDFEFSCSGVPAVTGSYRLRSELPLAP
jgi:hypothetical protein